MLNAIPANSVSFKGAEVTEEKKPLTASDIKQKTDEFTKGLDAASEGIKDATDSVTGAVATVGGATTMIGAAIKKIIPKPVLDFFSKAKIDKETGKEVLDKAGEVVKQADWKKLGIAGAIVAGVTLLTVGVVHLVKKNKAKETEAVKQEQYPDNFVKVEKEKIAEVEEETIN